MYLGTYPICHESWDKLCPRISPLSQITLIKRFPIDKETNGMLLIESKTILLLGYIQNPQLLFADIDLIAVCAGMHFFRAFR